MNHLTPGQAAYEADVRRRPTYHDGSPRRPWSSLDEFARSSWEKYPTPAVAQQLVGAHTSRRLSSLADGHPAPTS